MSINFIRIELHDTLRVIEAHIIVDSDTIRRVKVTLWATRVAVRQRPGPYKRLGLFIYPRFSLSHIDLASTTAI